ncbi:MAG: hypothetical protein ACJ8FY_01520 [Gemmataceae bacterium]
MNELDDTSSLNHPRSGKVNWAAFLPLAALALSVSAGLAFGMNFLFEHGLYYIPVVALFAGLISAGMVLLAVHKGRCRIAVIGLLLGLLAGIGTLAGYYYVGMVSTFGAEMASRPDLLPEYITLRMKTDMRDDDRQGFRRGANPGAPQLDVVQFGDRLLVMPRRDVADMVFNWILLGFDACLIVLLPTIAGFAGARRGFCENCQRWQSKEQALFPYGHGDFIAEMITSGNLSALQNLETFAIPQKKGANTSLVVEYCRPDEGQAATCPAYVTVKEGRIGRPLSRFPIGRDQIAQLVSRLPGLSVLLDEGQAATVPATAETSDAARPTAIAEISPIQDPYRGNILSKRVLIVCSALTMAILLLFLGSMFMALGGLYLCTDQAKKEGWPVLLTDNAPLLVALGAVLFPPVTYIGLRSPNFFAEWYLKKRAKSEIRSRPNGTVDPDDPDATFVQIVPRCNWGRVMLETATDVGFLKMDEDRREVLFEGDKERYRIPGPAIISCGVEPIVYGEGTAGRMIQYTAVLRAQVATGVWENPIGQRGDFGTLGANKRLRLAEELRDKMLSIRG